MWLRQSTSVVVSFGPALDKTTGVDLEVGLVSALDHATTGIMLSKNGGALAVRSAAVTASTYDARGNYRVTLSTTDTNTLGALRMQFEEAATCLPIWQDFMVVPANVWDSMFGADVLQVDVTQQLGAAVPALVGGRHDVSVGAMAANVLAAAALAADAGAEIADAILDRDMATGADSGSTTVRTVRQALRFLRNKWSITGTTLTVTKEDDATASWTAALTATAGADPVTASDPAGP